MSKLIKQTVASLLFYSGLLALWVWCKRTFFHQGEFIILTYHCFLPIDHPLRNVLEASLCVTPENFDRQLLFYQKHYRLVSLDFLIDCLSSGKPLPARTLVITVDDGWRDNYEYAYPLLRRHASPATIFLTADYIGTGKELWFSTVGRILNHGTLSVTDLAEALARDSQVSPREMVREITDPTGKLDRSRFMGQLKLLDLKRQEKLIEQLEQACAMTDGRPSTAAANMLTWEQVREMSVNGVDFGDHGCTHRIMTLLKGDEIADELRRSREIFKVRMEKLPRHFAYPNGSFDHETATLVRKAGFDSALATGGGKRTCATELDRYMLRRIGMHDNSCTGVTGRFSNALLAWHLARFG